MWKFFNSILLSSPVLSRFSVKFIIGRALLVSLSTVTIRGSLVHLASPPLFISVGLSIVRLLISGPSMVLNSAIVICIIIKRSFQVLARGIQVDIASLFGALIIRGFLPPVWWRLLIMGLIVMGLLLIQIRDVVLECRLGLQGWFSGLQFNVGAGMLICFITTNVGLCRWLIGLFLTVAKFFTRDDCFFLLTNFVSLH